MHHLILTTALLASPPMAPAPVMAPAATTAASANVTDALAEMLGKAVLTLCRPSSLKHGSTMLAHDWSLDGDFWSLTAKLSWYGYFSKEKYTSKVRIEVFMGNSVPKVTSIEYSDNCLTPCEMCKKLGEVRDVVNRQLEDAAG